MSSSSSIQSNQIGTLSSQLSTLSVEPLVTKAPKKRDNSNFDWEDLDQLAQSSVKLEETGSAVFNLSDRNEGFETAQKSRDQEFLKQFQKGVDLHIAKVVEKNMGKRGFRPMKDVFEKALESTQFFLVFGEDSREQGTRVINPSLDYTKKQWEALESYSLGSSTVMTRVNGIYRGNLIVILRKQGSITSKKGDSSVAESGACFIWGDLRKLSMSCIGLRHVSSRERAYAEATVNGLRSGSALNISPQFHKCFTVAKDRFVEFDAVMQKEEPTFLAQFQKGVLWFIANSVVMDIPGSIEAGLTKKNVFKKIFDKCHFLVIDFGYDEENERNRRRAMTPTDLGSYGEGLGQYCRKCREPGGLSNSSLRFQSLN
jgi:hypothetical protein